MGKRTLQNLLDLKEKYRIESPITKPLRDAAEKKLTEITLIKEIEKGNNTVKNIAQKIKEPQSFIRTELKRLVNKGQITVNKTNKPYKFYNNKQPDKTSNTD
jgi:predicted transcriptional regulator